MAIDLSKVTSVVTRPVGDGGGPVPVQLSGSYTVYHAGNRITGDTAAFWEPRDQTDREILLPLMKDGTTELTITLRNNLDATVRVALYIAAFPTPSSPSKVIRLFDSVQHAHLPTSGFVAFAAEVSGYLDTAFGGGGRLAYAIPDLRAPHYGVYLSVQPLTAPTSGGLVLGVGRIR